MFNCGNGLSGFERCCPWLDEVIELYGKAHRRASYGD
jgi:hypothetical protein